MLIRVTSGLSGAGGVAYQTDADFLMADGSGGRCCSGGGGALSSCPRTGAGTAHDGASAPGPRSWRSPRRNSSMSARRVLRRSGSSNGYEVDGGDGGNDTGATTAASVVANSKFAAAEDRFSRSVHTSFMAHCRFCLLTKDPDPAVVPIGELRKNNIHSVIYLLFLFHIL